MRALAKRAWAPGTLPQDDGHGRNEHSMVAVDVSTVVRPGRVRNRSKSGEVDEKAKKPADGVRKKSPPPRKAPQRGRYVDEYARPAP